MRLVFDLDGCVISNKRATALAYHTAGVRALPVDWFHKSGWATTAQREAKSRVYPEYLATYATILPAGRILLQTGGVLLSGCSRNSLETFLSVFPQFARPDIACLCEFSADEKIAWLKQQKPGVYFDDWDVMVQRVNEETQWQGVSTSRF